MTNAHNPFGQWLQARGVRIVDITRAPGLARKLSETPEKIAPNSPMLAELATELGVPLDEVQQFAKGPPMGEQWVAKLTTQIKNGQTGKRSAKHGRKKGATRGATKRGVVLASVMVADARAPRRRHRESMPAASIHHAQHGFAKLVLSKGTTMKALAERLHLKPSILWNFSYGGFSPTHHAIPKVAKALGVPESEIAQFAERRSRSDKHEAMSGEANPLKQMALTRVETNGNGGKPAHYNKLKKLDVGVRQSVRAMVATLNIGIMRGDTHMPPIPVGDLYLILEDYLKAKGVPGNVLVDPRFADLFDKR